MATNYDKTIGLSMIACSAIFFIYYTFWVVILPFVDTDHILHKLYPSPKYALALPIIIGVVGVFGLGIFIGVVIIKSKLKEKAS